MATPSPVRILPHNPSLEQHKKQAKDLLHSHRLADLSVAARLRATLPRLARATDAQALGERLTLSEAQLVIAREHGFLSWPKFRRHVEERASLYRAQVNSFLAAATSEPNWDHRAGTISDAREMLAVEPRLGVADIYAAATIGDAVTVETFLQVDSHLSSLPGGPRDWPPLLYLAFSRILRLEPERAIEFVRTAEALLKHGADPNSAFEEGGHSSALYGAAGVARCPALTKLLLEVGANPDDGEAVYHGVEGDNLDCFRLMVEYGHDLNSTGTALLRRLDFDDLDGVRWLLEAGANPEAGLDSWGKTALHQALMRQRGEEFISLLLDHGADPNARMREGRSVYSLAARLGRTDVIKLLDARGVQSEMEPRDYLVAACAVADETAARAVINANPEILSTLSSEDVGALVDAAAAGKTETVRLMLDLGFPISGPGGGAATPLHQACLNGRGDTVALLVSGGAPLDVTDSVHEATPLVWAMHGSTSHQDSEGRYAAIVERLIVSGARLPAACGGSASVDAVLRRHGLT